jgi:hypothetical protein
MSSFHFVHLGYLLWEGDPGWAQPYTHESEPRPKARTRFACVPQTAHECLFEQRDADSYAPILAR